LVFGDEAVLQVVLVGEGPVAVIDVYEAAAGVVAVVNLLAVSQGLHQHATSRITLVLSDELAAVVAEFGFLQQLTIEIVFISGATTVESGFLLDQAVGVVVEVILLATFVFDVAEQQARVVVAIAQLAAIRVDAATDQEQVIGVFEAGDATQFITFGGDFAVGVVGECTGCATGQGDLREAVRRVPLVLSDRAAFVLASDLPPQRVGK
jgi:hypothetical protein